METQLSFTWRSCSGIRFHRPCGWSGSHSVTPNLHVRGGACRGEEKAIILALLTPVSSAPQLWGRKVE